MKWEDTVASSVRWASEVKAFLNSLGSFDVVWEDSVKDYTGKAEVLVKFSKDKYIHYKWTYGSCAGCDNWDGMESEKVRADIARAVATYNLESLATWLTMLEKTRKDPDWDDSIMAAIRKEIAPTL